MSKRDVEAAARRVTDALVERCGGELPTVRRFKEVCEVMRREGFEPALVAIALGTIAPDHQAMLVFRELVAAGRRFRVSIDEDNARSAK